MLGKVIIMPTNPPRKINDAAIRELPKRRRRWNWRRAAGNLLTVVAIVGVGVWYGWMIFLPWWTGSVW